MNRSAVCVPNLDAYTLSLLPSPSSMAPSHNKDEANLGPAPITPGGSYTLEVCFWYLLYLLLRTYRHLLM